MMAQVFLVSVFGLVGVLCRYFLGVGSSRFFSPEQMFALVPLINIVGSFLIGILYGIDRPFLTPDIRVALMTGFLGGFTTFSAFSLDTVRLVEKGETLSAALYVGTSVGFGILATALGIWSGKILFVKV